MKNDVLAVFRIRIGFNADPDPAFSVSADPDADPDPGFRWPKKKNLQLEKINTFEQKFQFTYS